MTKMPDNPGTDRRLTDEVSAVLRADADVVFSEDRLARQRARILQQIDALARPGRVITFPAGQPPRPSLLRPRPGMRWIASAAAAGLIIGVAAGHLVHQLPWRTVAVVPSVAVDDSAPATLQAVATTMSEEELLGRLEVALEGTGGAALRPLDDLTPLVWEVTAQ